MGALEKSAKLGRLLGHNRFARTLLRHRVAATTEHLDAIRFCAPATLIDIGANKGQFATAVRGLFPNARIHAFEPFPDAADRFEAVFAGDRKARLHRVAIGDRTETRSFYVADREDSSSLLKPGSGQREAYGVGISKQIEVEVKPLGDAVDFEGLARPILLKIDVQGTELDVLKGIAALEAVDAIYVELSFVELYEGQALFEDVRAYLTARGFALRGVFNQSFTRAFGPTQADCLFVRAEAPAAA